MRNFYGGNHVLLCNWNRNSFQQRTFEEKSRAQYGVENDEMSDIGRLKYIITSEKSGWEQEKSRGNEKTFSFKMKFYYFCLKLEWTKLDVENIWLFVVLEQKSGVFV